MHPETVIISRVFAEGGGCKSRGNDCTEVSGRGTLVFWFGCAKSGSGGVLVGLLALSAGRVGKKWETVPEDIRHGPKRHSQFKRGLNNKIIRRKAR